MCWLLSKKELAGRLARWAAFVQGIELEIVHKSGNKHTDADALSRYPIEEGENEIDELDNNYIPLCTMEITNSEIQGQGTQNLIRLQKTDDHFGTTYGQLTSEQTNKKLKNFVIQDQVLYHRKIKGGKLFLRTCVPNE